MITEKDVANLQNRLEAQQRSKDYNARNFVDVPIGQLKDLLSAWRQLHLVQTGTFRGWKK